MSETPQLANQAIQPGQNPAEFAAWQDLAVSAELAQTVQVSPEQVQALGQAAVAHVEQVDSAISSREQAWGDGFSSQEAGKPTGSFRTEMVDDISFQTDLPEGVWPFEPTEPGETPQHPFSRPILPSALDSMPVGEFQIGNPQTQDATYNRRITITEDTDGKYINAIGDNGLISNKGKTQQVMEALGYKFGDSFYMTRVEALPTPNTIQKKAAELGVDIQFFPDQKLIEGTSYLEAFAAEKYPVSTASTEYYLHDTRDDHITAMVIGGEPLKAALRDSAKQALEAGLDANERAGDIDDFTAYLRGTVSPTLNNLNRPYGEDTLLSVGQRAGLSAEKVHQIVDTARANAQKFGMELNQPATKPVSLRKAA
jgi:hypothetical protein